MDYIQTPESRGAADAYYGRPAKPHKRINGKDIFSLTEDEIKLYYKGYYEEDERKDWQ